MEFEHGSLLVRFYLVFHRRRSSSRRRRQADGGPIRGDARHHDNQIINSKECRVGLEVDFNKYGTDIPVFREAFLNRDFSSDFYAQRRKQVLVYVVVKRIVEAFTEGLYVTEPPTVPICKFSLDISYFDKFGQTKTIPTLAWSFTSQIASKIKWANIDPKDFSQIAPDFKINDDVTQWMSDEPSMAGNQSHPAGSADRPVGDCNMQLFNANAIFIRVTTFCSKDYMDSPSGLKALQGAKKCAASMGEAEGRKLAELAMLSVDKVVKQHGRRAACQMIENLAQRVASTSE